MIHFDHSFLVEASYDIYNSSNYDFTREEKEEAINELRDLEIEDVLSKFDLEGVTEDQLKEIKETLTLRMNSFLKIGYGMVHNVMPEPLEGNGMCKGVKYPKNIEDYDYNHIRTVFNRSKLYDHSFGIGLICNNIEDYNTIIDFHNSNEKVYNIKKSGFDYPLNRNLYEVEDRIKKIREMNSSLYENIKDKRRESLGDIDFLKGLQKLNIGDIKLMLKDKKLTSDISRTLRDISRLIKPRPLKLPIDLRIFDKGVENRVMDTERWEKLKQWTRDAVTYIETNPLVEMGIELVELDNQSNAMKKEIIEYIETSTLKLSYYEQFKNQLKEEFSTTEAEAI